MSTYNLRITSPNTTVSCGTSGYLNITSANLIDLNGKILKDITKDTNSLCGKYGPGSTCILSPANANVNTLIKYSCISPSTLSVQYNNSCNLYATPNHTNSNYSYSINCGSSTKTPISFYSTTESISQLAYGATEESTRTLAKCLSGSNNCSLSYTWLPPASSEQNGVLTYWTK